MEPCTSYSTILKHLIDFLRPTVGVRFPAVSSTWNFAGSIPDALSYPRSSFGLRIIYSGLKNTTDSMERTTGDTGVRLDPEEKRARMLCYRCTLYAM